MKPAPHESFLHECIAKRTFPGASYAFGSAVTMHIGAVGQLSYGDSVPVQVDTLYDLASLTKVIATTEVVRCLHRDETVQLEQQVRDLLPGFAHKDVIVEHLLRHTSGLPAYIESPSHGIRESILQQPLLTPPGEVCVYSCVGFVVLQMIVEKLTGQKLDQLFNELVSPIYGFQSTGFRANAAPDRTVPPTTDRADRGVVHDPLAGALGGVSGNAGLFGNATELGQFAHKMLIDSDIREWNAGSGQRGRGWDRKSESGSSCGSLMSYNSFGHTGFTGTSMWIDPHSDFFVVLLTNTIYPSGDRVDLQQVRAEFADRAYRWARQGA